jgi:outer membrane protein
MRIPGSLRGRLASVVLLVIWSLPLTYTSAQDAQPPAPLLELRLGMREAMDAALNNNAKVRLFKEKIEAARGVSLTQLGALLPNISSNVRQTQQTVFLGTIGLAPVRTGPFSIFDARASVTQYLFSMSLIQRWRASREALKAAEFDSGTSNADAMAEVALLYVEGLRADAVVKAREANVDLFTEMLDLVHGRRGGGMATGLDTARLEGQLANERQQLEIAKSEGERIQANLLRAIGISYGVRLVLTDNLKTDLVDVPEVSDAIARGLDQRMEMRAQRQRIKTASLAMSSIVNERLPSVSGQGDYGLIGNRWNNTLDTYTLGLTLSIPIFDGGQREGRIKEARSQHRQESVQLQVVGDQVTQEVREAVATLSTARQLLSLARNGLEASLTELELARARYSMLTTSSHLEVTNALYAITRARENAVDAMFRLNASRVNLGRAVGQIDQLR